MTPARPAWEFSPASRDYTNLVVDRSSEDYAGNWLGTVSISGTVRNWQDAAYAGVPIVFTGTGDSAGVDFMVLAAADGTYSQDVPFGWSGSVSSNDDYRLEPVSRDFVDIGAPASAGDFAAFRNYFVATGGSDSGNFGGIAVPFATLAKAFGIVAPGDTIFLRGGTYIGDGAGFARLEPTASGTPTAYITLSNYQDEHVIIDRNYAGSSWTFINFIKENAYWKIRGLEIVNFRIAFNFDIDSDYSSPPHDFVFEDITAHECGSYAVPARTARPGASTRAPITSSSATARCTTALVLAFSSSEPATTS